MAFIITGTGRCGTGLISELLTAVGIPCGHESVLNKDTGKIEWKDLYSESSWMALPFLPIADTPVITVTRHPMAVVRSFLETNTFEEEDEWIKRICPEVYKPVKQIDRAMLFWVEWNKALIAHTEIRMKIEEFDYEKFSRILGWTRLHNWMPGKKFSAITANNPIPTTPYVDKEEWEQVSVKIRNRATSLARLLGYEF